MKAIIANENHNADIVDKDVRPLKTGEALLDMEYCGVCHTDIHVKDADYGDETGRTLGHEGVGIVTEVADDVTSLEVGDRASVAWFFEGCGQCEYCVTGRETLCRDVINAGYTAEGAMAEKCIVPADYAVKVPEELDPVEATTLTCAGVTVYKGIKEAQLKPGDSILISGQGGLGNMALQFAKNYFNLNVIVSDINNDKLEFAKEYGADYTINPSEEDLEEFCQNELGGTHGAVVTAVSKSAFNEAVNSVRAGARVVAIGLPNEMMDLSIPRLVLDGIQVVGSLVGTRQDLAKTFQAGKTGAVKPRVEVRSPYDINDIFQEMEDGEILGRMVLDLNEF